MVGGARLTPGQKDKKKTTPEILLSSGISEVKLAIEILRLFYDFIFLMALPICGCVQKKKIKFLHNNMYHSLLLAICQNYFPDTD